MIDNSTFSHENNIDEKELNKVNFTEIENKLTQIKNSFENSGEFNEDNAHIKEVIIEAIYDSLSKKQMYKSHIKDIIDIIQSKLINSQSIDTQIKLLNILEELFYLFIFHFDFEINCWGFSIEKFILTLTESNFHSDLLANLFQIIHMLNIKRTVNSPIASFLISNCSLCLNILINSTSQEVKREFIDFFKKNYTEHSLIYLFVLSCEGNNNYANIFSNDQISEVITKYKAELDKSYKQLESYMNKFDDSLNSRSQIRQILNKIGFICKIIDSFITRGHRTYNIDKAIKNLIPLARKIITVILMQITKADFDISPETIDNILQFLKGINCFDSETAVKMLNWNNIFLQYDLKYISNIETIVHILIDCTVTDQSFCPNAQKIDMIIKLIFTFIEYILSKQESKNDNVIQYNIIKLYKYIMQINPNCTVDKQLYPNVYSYFIEGKFGEEQNFKKDNYDYYTRLYSNSLNGNGKKVNEKFFLECFKNFEIFKNSMKSIYNLDSIALSFEKKIENFKGKINRGEVKINELEEFFLECSYEMYKDIFQQK